MMYCRAIVRECPFTFVMKKFKVENPSDLKTFTDEHYPQGSFAFAALLRARDIRVNGVRTSKNVPLHVGDEVTYFTSPAQEAKLSHNVIFEDENVRVCDKFSGVSTEGLASELNFMGSYFAVHRLDILFAKMPPQRRSWRQPSKSTARTRPILRCAKIVFQAAAVCLRLTCSRTKSRQRCAYQISPARAICA